MLYVCVLAKEQQHELEQLLQAIEESKDESYNSRLELLEKLALANHFRLEDRGGEGDCQFRAIAHQLLVVKGLQIGHMELRSQIVEFLRQNPNMVNIKLFFSTDTLV